MPFTPYHFGLSGFIGLTLRKWIDVPVFVLANVIVDLEVLIITQFGLTYPIHRFTHTLLIGSAAGIIWALAAYPLRNFFTKIMRILRIPYQPNFWKMLISGVLGVWLHVVIDAIYHKDVRVFWPSRVTPLYAMITRQQVNLICTIFFIPAVIAYILAVIAFLKNNSAETKISEKEGR